MRKLALLFVLALVAVPSAALAAAPPERGAKGETQSRAAHQRPVMFVLRGKLSSFTPAQGTTNGSITIEVKASNHQRRALRGMSLTFAVTEKTKVVLAGSLADGDRGIVKVRAPRRANAEALQALPARQVVDQQS